MLCTSYLLLSLSTVTLSALHTFPTISQRCIYLLKSSFYVYLLQYVHLFQRDAPYLTKLTSVNILKEGPFISYSVKKSYTLERSAGNE